MIEINIQPLNLSVEYESLVFSGGEIHVQITGFHCSETGKIYHKIPKYIGDLRLDITARIKSSDDLMELMLLTDALKHMIDTNVQIHLTLPYMPYARQDRVCAEGQAHSIDVFQNILYLLPATSITTWDIHSEAALEGFYGIKYNISQADMLRKKCNYKFKHMFNDTFNPILVCPDKGALQRTKNIRNEFDSDGFVPEIAYCEKVRNPKTGWIEDTTVDCSVDLNGRNVIIADDICDGGMTFILIAKKLKELGVENIILWVTHGIFSKGLKPFVGLIDEVWTTDSFYEEHKHDLCGIDVNIMKV